MPRRFRSQDERFYQGASYGWQKVIAMLERVAAGLDDRERSVTSFEVRAIGKVKSPLTDLKSAPLQADEGAPEAWLVFEPEVLEGLRSLQPSDQVIIITWLDRVEDTLLRPRKVAPWVHADAECRFRGWYGLSLV